MLAASSRLLLLARTMKQLPLVTIQNTSNFNFDIIYICNYIKMVEFCQVRLSFLSRDPREVVFLFFYFFFERWNAECPS